MLNVKGLAFRDTGIGTKGYTIVEQFATGVMSFCDATLGVLDGLLDM